MRSAPFKYIYNKCTFKHDRIITNVSILYFWDSLGAFGQFKISVNYILKEKIATTVKCI